MWTPSQSNLLHSVFAQIYMNWPHVSLTFLQPKLNLKLL